MKISRQVSMCGEASLKQSENVHLGLSCSGGQPGSVIWDLERHGSEGNSWSHQEMIRDTAKFHLGALVWCCCLKAVWTLLDPHCLCRGSSSAELGLNSVLLGGLEGDHRPESWTEGEGRIPHTKKKNGRCKPEAVWGGDYGVTLKNAKM